MKKKFLISLLGFLFLIPILSGCVNRNSREWIENQVSEEVSEIYPTEDLVDLFDLLPTGFTIEASMLFTNNGVEYQRTIWLVGDPETEDITGNVYLYEVTSEPYKKTVIASASIGYNSEDGVILTESSDNDLIFDKNYFLFQKLSLDKEKLESLSVVNKSYISQVQSASITYEIDEDEIFRFFDEPEDEVIEMGLSASLRSEWKNRFGTAVSFDVGDIFYSEQIREGMENINE